MVIYRDCETFSSSIIPRELTEEEKELESKFKKIDRKRKNKHWTEKKRQPQWMRR
jgi:hypothetical protein